MELTASARKLLMGAFAGVLALALGAGLTGCSGNSSSSSSSTKSSDGVQQVNITLKDNSQSADVTEVEAGVVTFNVTNESAAGISEFELLYNQKIVGEKENLAPGLGTVSFTVTLNGGDYKLYAPGADNSYVSFKVTGEAAAAPAGSTQEIMQEGVKSYASYIKEQGQYLQDGTAALQTAVESGDVEAAKKAWAAARPFYEHAESAVDNFLMPGYTIPEGEEADNNYFLDYLIDMRESNFDEAAGWHGFHAIERDLWENGAITDQTKAYAKELAENCKILNEQVLPSFADDMKPEDLANGAADLLEEVSTTKITGEEDKYSQLDLSDFRSNVEGAQQAYANLRDGLNKIDEDLVKRIDDEFQSVSDMLDTYRSDSELGGYVKYTAELQKTDANKLSEGISALHDDLAKLAEKVATA
jgi:iron uptake system component EfeO